MHIFSGFFWLCSVCHFYENHVTRNDVMDFWGEKRRKSVQHASMPKNEVKRVGGGIIKRDTKEDRMTSSNRGLVKGITSHSLSALLGANSCDVSQWTAHTADQLLTEGDAMYLKVIPG